MDEKHPGNDTAHNIWETYRAEQVKRAVGKSAGTLRGVDRDALLKDVRVARRQDTRGRPA
jgi:hypothetical protein